MATHKGSEGTVTADANTVAELTSWSFDDTAGTIDDSELSDSAATFLADKTSWTGSIEAHWDETDTTAQGAMLAGALVVIVFEPEGSTTGDAIFTGSAIITSRSLSTSIGSTISASFSLQGTGALVESTAA